MLSAFQTLQETPDIAKEGLPFWILWFLLLIILILMMFIFLRDKDLRRRISSFLSGARRRMARLRLQVKLRKEKEKKVSLWKELGKTAWHEDIRADCVETEFEKLAGIEEEIGRLQKTWHDVYSRIEALGREHEASIRSFRARVEELEKDRQPHDVELKALLSKRSEVREALEAEARSSRIRSSTERTPRLEEERRHLDLRIEEVEARVQAVNDRIREAGDEQKELLRAKEKEIREWQNSKDRLQDRIVENKRLMEPLFESAGRALDEARVENEELAVVYFQIDSVNKAVAEYEARIEHLK